MSIVNLSTSGSDADALEALAQRHAELLGTLSSYVDRLVAAASSDASSASTARKELVTWSRGSLSSLRAKEGTFYEAAHALPEAKLLVGSLVTGHKALAELVDQLDAAPDALRAAAIATAMRTLVEVHVRTENELLLPALAAAPDVSLAALHAQMEEVLSMASEASGGTTDGDIAAAAEEEHSCGCGETDDAPDVELDARDVPHAIRHATIFGALDSIPVDEALVLIAPHDPLPLLAQVEQRSPGAFDVSYLERGPEAWRLRFLRCAD